jgi:hypothetical protein
LVQAFDLYGPRTNAKLGNSLLHISIYDEFGGKNKEKSERNPQICEKIQVSDA